MKLRPLEFGGVGVGGVGDRNIGNHNACGVLVEY